MNISLFAALLVLPPTQLDEVGTVSMNKCLTAAISARERMAIMELITDTDADARKKLALLTATEAAIGESSTLLERSNAKLLKAEFALFRLRAQERIRKSEAEMLNRAFRRVEEAVRLVTERTECSVVVYERESTETEITRFTSLQIIKGAPRAVVLSHAARLDITQDVLEILHVNSERQDEE